jgi:glycosyltransferase involved in cell wall biosynthesis
MEELIARTCGSTAIPFQLLPYRIAEAFTSLPAPSPQESPSRSIRIAYVGRLEAFQKRVRRLPEIIRQIHKYEPAAHWEILGDGPEREFLIRQLSRHDLQDCVTFHRWMSPADIVQTLRSCHLFFLCSRWEGLPIAMVEAMLCGLAPVVPNLPAGVSDLISSRAGWKYEPNTVPGAVQALREAIGNKDLQSRRTGAWSAAHRMTLPASVTRQFDDLFSRMQHLAHNGRAETNLDIPPIHPLAFHQLPSALARRAIRRFRNLLP